MDREGGVGGTHSTLRLTFTLVWTWMSLSIVGGRALLPRLVETEFN